jgi:hypothetical protein
MFEVYYKSPPDPQREERITAVVASLGGLLSYREVPEEGSADTVCLTYEFNGLDSARTAADSLRLRGEHVEGPVDYGD